MMAMHRRSPPSPRLSRGFTLIELLVVVAIIALLISILLPSLGKAKEIANRVHCSANIHGIAQVMIEYAQVNSDLFPSVVGPTDGATYTASLAPYGSGGVSNDPDVTIANYYSAPAHRGSPLACMWLMVLQRMPSKMFLCKSDRNAGVPAAITDSSGRYFDNFQDGTQISYSIANPWAANGAVGPWWRDRTDTGTALIADMAPLSGDGGKITNSLPGSIPKVYSSGNHENKGQCVGFGDAHVDWTTTPYINSNQDNIWTAGAVGSQSGGAPITAMGQIPTPGISANQLVSGAYDVVMTPVRKTSDNSIGP